MNEHDEAAAPDFAIYTIRLHYETTQDNANGAPWPPDGDGDILWRAIGDAGGFTKWRRIALVT